MAWGLIAVCNGRKVTERLRASERKRALGRDTFARVGRLIGKSFDQPSLRCVHPRPPPMLFTYPFF